MPFTQTRVVVSSDAIMEMFGADEYPTESTVRASPDGEWRIDVDGNWRFWRYDEE